MNPFREGDAVHFFRDGSSAEYPTNGYVTSTHYCLVNVRTMTETVVRLHTMLNYIKPGHIERPKFFFRRKKGPKPSPGINGPFD